MRKRVSILASLALCIGLFTFGAPTASAAHLNNDCDLFGSTNKSIGNSYNPSGYTRGAIGTIDPLGASYHLCSQGINSQGGYTHEELFSFIGIEDNNNNNNHAFVGIIRCNYTFDTVSYCDDNGDTAHWILEREGCGYSRIRTDLGVADFYATEYRIYAYNNTFYVAIDGVNVYTTTLSSSERLDCWLDGNNDVRVRARADFLDGGDQLAVSSDYLNFDDVGYVNFGDLGFDPVNFGSPCDQRDSSSELAANCVINNGRDFDVWQTPN